MTRLRNIENILIGLTVEDNEESTAAVNYGLSLAKTAHAQVTIFAPSVKLIPPFVGRIDAHVVATENLFVEELARAVVKRIQGEADHAGVEVRVSSPQLKRSELVEAFTKEARLHDLCVLDCESQALDVDRDLIEAALLDSGRPVIVVPPESREFRARHIIVAWDGSSKAARALFDALPILRLAESVEVLQVDGEKDLSAAIPGSAVESRLLAHKVHSTAKRIVARDGDVAGAISRYANETGADLIVMGGFAHARMRQLIFGGVTHGLLRNCSVPLFLSH
jgi:nucleotide-binding universal stress UspA family protein